MNQSGWPMSYNCSASNNKDDDDGAVGALEQQLRGPEP